jgi:hypothetical protein
LILGKTGVTSSEVYASGLLDKQVSAWLAERLREAGLGAG